VFDAVKKPAPAVYVLDRPGSAQTVIVAAHTTTPSGQSDDLALDVVMRNFGGIATSRLMRNLRLDKHWSYGVFGGVRNARGPRTFAIVTLVQSDKAKESMIEIAREIREIAGTRPMTGEEFVSAMRNQTMRLPARFETLDDLERAAIDVDVYGLPDDFWAVYPTRLRALTESDLAAAARAHVRPDDIVWIVVGDADSLEKSAKELGYGEVVRLRDVP
jgi:zinc protease